MIGRGQAIRRAVAGATVLGLVLATAGSAGSTPTPDIPSDGPALYADCLRKAQQIIDRYRDADDTAVAVACSRPDGSLVDTTLWVPAVPTPPAPVPVGRCVTGPGRPVVDTALTSVSATNLRTGIIIYEHQALGDGEAVDSGSSGALEFGPGELTPGSSYRWRARAEYARTDETTLLRSSNEDERAWSPWCEFTVSADAVDYSGLGDVSLEALTELGLRPDRTYAVHLSGRQQRLLRAGTDIGRTRARMALSGVRWTDLLVQLTGSAYLEDEVAAETGDAPQNSADYRTLVDTISAELGGPDHPRLN
ncbi:hypothetical protein [Actinoplanes sp. CA-252034]|uniref:hypothetical protein n=1 Tax=Actinoplanes sp. CA-252034 TaxID=3239906 RepID=UPI003D9770EB